jgi:hypothetical protein
MLKSHRLCGSSLASALALLGALSCAPSAITVPPVQTAAPMGTRQALTRDESASKGAASQGSSGRDKHHEKNGHVRR